MYLSTAGQAKQIEQAVAKKSGGNTYDLMELIGTRVAEYIADDIPSDSKVVIVCGRGNNGGDGLVCARNLLEKNFKVSVFSTEEPLGWTGDAGLAFNALSPECQSQIININDKKNIPVYEDSLKSASLIVDCIFGSGLSREIEGIYKYAIDSLNSLGATIYSIDIPSGFNADTGGLMGAGVKAEITFAAGTVKQGLTQYPCASHTGEIIFVDMGVDKEIFDRFANAKAIDEAMAASWLPERKADGHKKAFGVVGVIAGSLGMGGAAYLCSESCLRSGAGLVFLLTPKSLTQALQSKVTETILVPLQEGNAGCINLAAASQVKVYDDKVDIIIIGPGLSVRDEAIIAIRQIIQNTSAHLVIDASGIDALINQERMIKNVKQNVILTPHPGELSRLIKVPVKEIQSNRMKYAMETAERFSSVLVLKGARTVIAAPNGKVYVCTKGNSGMATAGTGDVLAGIIGAFLGQKMDPFHAAALGAEIHAAAGDFTASDLTEYSMVAGDIIDYLPVAFKYYEELR